jgi:hypothetical protein
MAIGGKVDVRILKGEGRGREEREGRRNGMREKRGERRKGKDKEVSMSIPAYQYMCLRISPPIHNPQPPLLYPGHPASVGRSCCVEQRGH